VETVEIQTQRESRYPIFFLTERVVTKLGSILCSMTWETLQSNYSPLKPEQITIISIACQLDDYLAEWHFDPKRAANCADTIGKLIPVTEGITPYKEVHQALVQLGQNKLDKAAEALLSLKPLLSLPLQCLHAKILCWQGKTHQAGRILKGTVAKGHLTSNVLLAFLRSPPGILFGKNKKLLVQAADGGQRRAQYWLGSNGDARFLQRAAQQGDLDACCILGARQIVARQPHGMQWLQYAAKNFHAGSTCWIGACALFGVGTEPNEKLAFDYFGVAAQLGNRRAKWNLALCHLKGKGTAINQQSALKLYDEIVSTCEGKEGNLFKNGFAHVFSGEESDSPFTAVDNTGTQQDQADALALHKLAAEHGRASGFFGQALHYQHAGGGLGKEEVEQLFQKANQAGHSHADRYLPKRRRRRL
jgi:Sel1 repeat